MRFKSNYLKKILVAERLNLIGQIAGQIDLSDISLIVDVSPNLDDSLVLLFGQKFGRQWRGDDLVLLILHFDSNAFRIGDNGSFLH